MTVKDIKNILSTTAYKNADIYSYKHLTGGLMNTIWRVDTSLGRLIIKIYDLERNLVTASKTMEIWKNFVSVPEPINDREITYEGKKVIVYRYINGEELSHPDHRQIEEITNIIRATNIKINKIAKDDVIKIDVVEKQYEALKKLKKTKIDQKVVKDIIKGYEEIKYEIRDNSKYIGHDDLNYSNILWYQGQLFGVIDFDEASICTKEYELVVFATKHCMIEDYFDTYYLYEILKQYYGELNIEILDTYTKSFKFYTLKVLFEKVYYYQFDIIDIYNERQIRDNWNWWYNLYKDIDNIMDKLKANLE